MRNERGRGGVGPVAAVLLAAFFLFPSPSFSEPVATVEYKQVGKSVHFNLSRMVTIRPGDDYSSGEVERNRRLLETTGLFKEVEVTALKEPAGYRIVIRVTPYHLVRKVSLLGNFLLLKKDLVRLVRLREGEPFREETVREDVAGLLRTYENEGYGGTVVEAEIEEGRKGLTVVYRIDEGKPGVIRSWKFSGNESVPKSEISAAPRLTLYTFFRRENLVESVDRIERFYRERGFFDVAVEAVVERGDGIVLPAFAFVNPVKGLATLIPGQYDVIDVTFSIDEGRKYEVEFAGNESFVEADLRSRLTFSATGFFDEHEAEIGRGLVEEFYRLRGYYHAEVVFELDREESRVSYAVREGERYRLARLEVRGGEFFGEEEIRSWTKSWESGFTGDRLLVDSLLGKDVRRIRDHYREEGFLNVLVHPPEVILDDASGEAAVVVNVAEGVRTLVGGITFDGVTSVSDEELREVIKSREGMPYRPDWVSRDKERILRLVGSRGYPECRVKEKVRFSDRREEVEVEFAVDEGPHTLIGKMVVVGNRKTVERVILREFPLRPGDPYSIAGLTEGKRNLYGLGFFRRVSLESPATVEGGGVRDVVIRVRERPTGRFRVAAGFNSEDGPGGFVEIAELNLFGRGSGLSLRVSGSAVRQRYDLFYREPRPFGYRINSEVNLFNEFREETGYDVTSRGVSVGVKKEFGRHLIVNPRYRFEFVEYGNVELNVPVEEEEDLESINISSAIVFFRLDFRDDPVEPRVGSNYLFGVELATPLLGGDTAFNKYTFETSWYLPLGEKTVLALGFRGGFSQTFTGFHELPLSERFYLGGSRGVRGYKKDTVGPKDVDGNPIGGDTYALGIAEFRFPLGKKRWRGVAFFDMGNVWADLEGIDPTEVKYSAGVGLRYKTPVGPLRLDYGHKMNPDEGDSSGRFHFSIGFPI